MAPRRFLQLDHFTDAARHWRLLWLAGYNCTS